ncbi:MAG: 3-deoxy-D-manno-octulosonate 8-phosphate phosphatase [Chitinophagaceae bacterium]|nr:3-deoxy-D-manno-octulosonate 8-phosphate phosphatase [Chitinophagaceae bacterium]
MNVLQYFKNITTFVFDVDGVLTDGTVYLVQNAMARRMSVKDGYVLQLAIKKGYRVLVISGSSSDEVVTRLNKLGITDVYMDVQDKLKLLEDYMQQHKITKEEVLCMGDDIPDYEMLKHSGLPACPSDAVMEIRHISKYASPHKGGEGCVRDVIEKVLKLRDDWEMDTSVKSK